MTAWQAFLNMRRQAGIVCGLASSLLAFVLATAAIGAPFQLSYGGRLTEASGKPLTGPVNLRVTFFRSLTGSDQVAVAVPDFTGVVLQDGMFQINLNLSAADFHAVFNGLDPAYIQIEDLGHGVTYPRQEFSAVPYALKVPVDGTSITYNANGRLSLGNGSTTLSLPATAGSPNQVLKTNGSGVLSWANDETAGAGSVTSGAIANDTIMNEDINSGAGIAGTKISPNFGAQNVVTTGSVTAAFFSGDGSGLTNLPAGPIGASVDSAEIVNDTIVDADINTSAAIAGTKISPNFGAQNVVTTGSVTAASFSGDGSGLTNLPAGALGTSVDSAEIVNDTIVDADVNTNAAIAGSKISPNFGVQNVVTTGNVTGAEVKATSYLQTGAVAGAPSAGECDVAAEYGRLRVDTTNNRLYVCSTSGWVLAANNAGALLSTQNLADVGDASLARANLGLGGLATKGSVADADVAAGAAIAGSKISPNFGAQNVVTTGSVTGEEVKATSYLQTGTVAGAPAVGDCDAVAEHGRLRVDTTNNRLYLCSTSGWVLAVNNSNALLSTQNLADLGNTSTARTNLGLGAAATKGVGAGANDVAAGDHGHADATTGSSGFMSATDKTRLNNAVVTTDTGTVSQAMIADGSISVAKLSATMCAANQILRMNGDGTALSCANESAGAPYSVMTFMNYSSDPSPCPSGWSTAGGVGYFKVDENHSTVHARRVCITSARCSVLSLTAVGTLASCPAGWTEADLSYQRAANATTSGNKVRTCFICN